MTDLTTAARALVQAGISIVPCHSDKKAAIPWKEYQNRLMTEYEIVQHFTDAERLATICGSISGNLEYLDFDDPEIFQPFLELTEARKPGLTARLPKRRTPSGGFHIPYRCENIVEGNLKLACDKAHNVRIETRGEGGYALAPPSPGYTVIEHSLLNVPTLTTEDVELLHSTAKVFDQRPPISTTHGYNNSSDDRPGDQFKVENSNTELLEKYGWRKNLKTGLGMGYTRPGKDRGTSGVLLKETGNFYCWSSNAYPLESERSYNAFALYTAYEHGGDYSVAARSLACTASANVATVAVADWSPPLPLVTHQQAAPYPLKALPRTIGAAVGEVVGFVQCPVALGACSALAVVSMVAQGLVDVRRAYKLEGPTSLYILAIADSGERKTTVDGFFSKPVQQWEAEQAEAAKPDIKRHEAESLTWEAKKSGLLAAIKEGSKAGKDTRKLEKEIATLEMEKPKPPKVPRLLFSDATPEALAHRLAHNWPLGGVLSSEAGIVFGGHAMGKESAMRNMSMLNSLWGAEPLTIDRRSSPSYTVGSARLTMGLAVQSETVRVFLDSSKGLARGIGWLARFLIAWPESTQGNRMYQDPPNHWPHLGKFHRRLGALLDFPLPLDEKGDLEPVMLELSPEAKTAWITFHDEVEEELRPGRDMAEARDVASKAADNCARLAALFHLFENDPGATIGSDHIQAAASLVTWHLYEARRFIGEIALPIEMSNAVKLDEWLLEYCRINRAAEVATRTIQQMGPACTRKKRSLDRTLEELFAAERAKIVTKGRQKFVAINPALLGGGHGPA